MESHDPGTAKAPNQPSRSTAPTHGAETGRPRFTRFTDFYAFYLTRHASRMCRRAHFLGYSSAIAALAQFVDSPRVLWLALSLVSILAGGWVGHRIIDKSPQDRYAQPWYALRAGWTMYWHMLTGKLSW